MYISYNNNKHKIWDWVITKKFHKSLNGCFSIGSKVQIIGIDEIRGYDIQDEYNNKMCEIGWVI